MPVGALSFFSGKSGLGYSAPLGFEVQRTLAVSDSSFDCRTANLSSSAGCSDDGFSKASSSGRPLLFSGPPSSSFCPSAILLSFFLVAFSAPSCHPPTSSRPSSQLLPTLCRPQSHAFASRSPTRRIWISTCRIRRRWASSLRWRRARPRSRPAQPKSRPALKRTGRSRRARTRSPELEPHACHGAGRRRSHPGAPQKANRAPWSMRATYRSAFAHHQSHSRTIPLPFVRRSLHFVHHRAADHAVGGQRHGASPPRTYPRGRVGRGSMVLQERRR